MAMFDAVRSDSSISLSRLALDGLARRQDVNSENIANVDTPGYKAKEVNFEQTLQQMMSGTQASDLHLTRTNEAHFDISASGILFQTTEKQSGTPRADGNNVDIDNEFVQMNETGVRQQAITQLLARKLRLIKDVTKIR